MRRLAEVSVDKNLPTKEVKSVVAGCLVVNDMVITRSWSGEDARRATAERKPMADPNPRSNTPNIGGVDYASPTAFNDVLPDDF